MTALKLADAQAIIAATLSAARVAQLKPLSVVVLDSGAHPVACVREDGASLFRHDIARAKAAGALGMGADTRTLAARAADNPTFFQSVAQAVGGQIAFSPGGVLIRTENGSIIGAVGVSGDTGDNDEKCILAGLADAGFNHGNKK